MISAFGVVHDISKAYYHGTYAQLQPGDRIQTATERGHNTDHLPQDEKWRNDRVWATKSKRRSRSWVHLQGQPKPTGYKIKLEDPVKHKATRYDKGGKPDSLRAKFKGHHQYHGSSGTVL